VENRHFGYRNHVKAGKKSKLIKPYSVSDASVHDCQTLENLLEEADSNHKVYGDSVYSGEPIKKILDSRNIRSRIHEKGYRNNPLTEKQKEKNRHIFGFIHNSVNGSTIRSIGIVKAEAIIGLMNPGYNMNPSLQLQKM